MRDIPIPSFHLRNQAGKVLLETEPFTLEGGRTLAITGPSGAGKTLFLRALFGWIGSAPQPVLSPKNGAYMMIQDPLQGLTPGLSLAGHFREVGGANWRSKAKSILAHLDLTCENLFSRNARSFSGGERQRLMLALILIRQPSILVCDEPASSLDFENEYRLWSLLDDLKKRLGLTLIFVSHQLELFRRHADGIMLIEQGRNTYLGSDRDFFKNPRNAYHQKLLRAFDAKTALVSSSSQNNELKKKPLLEVRNFRLRYGKAYLFDDFSWSIAPGSWCWLAGKSGAGKTTLGRAIAGLVRQPFTGSIYLDETPLARELKKRTYEQRRQIQYLFQHGTNSLNPSRTVKVQLLEAFKGRESVLEEFLNQLGLDHLKLDRFPAAFSIGENQRFNLLRALSAEPKLIILDELLSPLDWALKYDIVKFLDGQVRDKGLTVICISHEPRLWRLRAGELVTLGDDQSEEMLPPQIS